MTKLQIISRLWSSVYDLLFLVKGTPVKSLEEIERDLDVIEHHCRPYADAEDPELIERRDTMKTTRIRDEPRGRVQTLKREGENGGAY